MLKDKPKPRQKTAAATNATGGRADGHARLGDDGPRDLALHDLAARPLLGRHRRGFRRLALRLDHDRADHLLGQGLQRSRSPAKRRPTSPSSSTRCPARSSAWGSSTWSGCAANRPATRRRPSTSSPPGARPRSVPPRPYPRSAVQSVRFEIPPCPPSAVDALRRELGVSDAHGPGARAPRPSGAGRRARLPGRRGGALAGALRRRSAWRSATILAHVRGRRPHHRPRRLRRRRHLLDGGARPDAARAGRRRRLATSPTAPTATGCSSETVRAAGGARHAPARSRPTARSRPSRRCARRASWASTVVVTDHHSPRADGALPEAPIVHPARLRLPLRRAVRDRGRLQARAGAARSSGAKTRARLTRDLDLVALATVADVVAAARREPHARAARPARARGDRQAGPARADGGGGRRRRRGSASARSASRWRRG